MYFFSRTENGKHQAKQFLSRIKARKENRDHDAMVPTKPNNYGLANAFPNSQTVIYSGTGHTGVFQFS